MKKLKYYRSYNRIAEVDENGFSIPEKVQVFKTINAAKRESRKLQIQNDGALGLGSLQTLG